MAINKKLLHFVSKSNFSTQLANSNIDSKSIVFIKDTGEIWTHDKLYSCASWGTNQTNYVPLTISGISYNLSKDGHTHSYLPLSGGQLTGQLGLLQGAGGGIIFPNDSFGGGGDSASIKLLNPAGGESTEMTFTMTNDADDIINFNVPSINGVKINRYTVWNAGNDGAGSGLDADLLDGVHITDMWGFSAPTNYDLNNLTSSYINSWNYDYATSASVLNQPLGNNVSDARGVLSIHNGYRLQLSWRYIDPSSMYVRSFYNGNWYEWKQFAFTTSNVASATKLQTTRSIWGQNFDGTGNISGALENATTGSFSSHVKIGGGTTNLGGLWDGGIIVGNNGHDKIVATYLTSSTNAATIGAHSSALDRWAKLNIAGTSIQFSINETPKMTLDSGGNLGLSGQFTSSGAIISNSAALGASTPFAITNSRIQSYTSVWICADTDNSTGEGVFISASKGVSTNPNDGLAIYNNTVNFLGNSVWHSGNLTGTQTGHTHNYTDLANLVVAGNEHNWVPNGYSGDMWINYQDRVNRGSTALIGGYHLGNGRGGYANIRTSGYIINGYDNNYVVLAGGGAAAVSGLNVSSANYAYYFPTAYIGGQQLNPQTYFNQGIGLKVAMTAAAGVWSDTLWINGYSGGDVLSMCALHTSRQWTPRMWISSQNSNGTSYGSLYEFVTTYNYSTLLDSRYRPMGGGWSGNGVPGNREFGFVTNDASGEVAFKSYNNTMNMIIDGNIYVTDNSYQVIHAGNIASQSVNYAISSSYQYAAGVSSSDWVANFQATPTHSTSFREMSSGGPSGSWWFMQNFRHSNGNSYWGRQIAWGWEDNAHEMYSRNITANSFSGWVRFLNSSNYNSFSPTLTGGNASGTWGINVTGAANRLYQGGTTSGSAMVFNWNGQGGQPTWLWGGTDGTNMYVYNPSNFNVASAAFLRSTGTGMLNVPDTGQIRYDYNVLVYTSGLFPASNNANSILSINRHAGSYDSQLGFSSDGNIYYRSFNATALDTTTAWKVLLDSWNYSSYALPLSGGTMTNSIFLPLNLPALRFGNTRNWDAAIGHDTYSYEVEAFMTKSIGSKYRFKVGFDPVSFVNGSFVNMTNADLEIGAGYCKINNNTVWHAGNDGAGSGLDADLLDGVHNGNVTAKYFSTQTSSLDANNPLSPYMWYYGQPDSNRTNWAAGDYGAIFTTLNENPTLNAQFNWFINHDSETPTNSLFFRASNNRGFKNDWKQIAFTTSNVASATYATSAASAKDNLFIFSDKVKLKWGGNTTPTLGFQMAKAVNAFHIEVVDGDSGGITIDNDGTTVYGAGDNGYVFRVVDEDTYASSTFDGATIFEVLQDSGVAIRRGGLTLGGTLLNSSDAGSLKITTSYGYTEIGSKNTDWVHFGTDRQGFYMDKLLNVNGEIRVYNSSTFLNATNGYIAGNNIWHSGNFTPGNYLPLTGGTLTGTLNALSIGVSNADSTTGRGISLYNGPTSGKPEYGIMFTGTSTFGTHGSVTGDWATYFTMDNTPARGWIFQRGSTNVASISGGGNAKFDGSVTANRFCAGYDSGVANTINCSGWFRSSGTTGWLNASYGGGIYQDDSTYVKIYGSKAFKVNSTASDSINTDGGIKASGNITTSSGFINTNYSGDNILLAGGGTCNRGDVLPYVWGNLTVVNSSYITQSTVKAYQLGHIVILQGTFTTGGSASNGAAYFTIPSSIGVPFDNTGWDSSAGNQNTGIRMNIPAGSRTIYLTWNDTGTNTTYQMSWVYYCSYSA